MSKARRLSRAPANTASAPGEYAPELGPDRPAPLERLKLDGVMYQNLVRDLRVLATRDDGWLRVVPDLDRQQVWLKWKFTRGQHERHYIMVCVEDLRVHYGMQILVRKLYDVDQGLLKPTMDRLYGQEDDQS